MASAKFAVLFFAIVGIAYAHHSAMDVAYDMYRTCLKDFSISCVQPKAMHWVSAVSEDPTIQITEDLVIVKKDDPESLEASRSTNQDIFDTFENFLQTHDLVAKVPSILTPNGPLGSLLPRSFQAEDLTVPLASTGRSSKVVKKIIVPFLLGLKFKTAVLVPLALALIALKTWKALTLGLLSMVLTAAMVIFKFTKPKVVNYEVIHYPHHDHHFDHHIDHVEHAPVATGWDHAGYGRELNAQEMAYNAYL